MKYTMCGLSLTLLTVGIVAIVNAKPFGKFCEWRKFHSQGHGHGLIRKVWKDFDLSDEQKSEIADILKSTKPEVWELVGSLGEAQKVLATAVLAESFDEAIVREAWSDLAAKKGDLTVLLANTFANIRETLTVEQKERLQSIHSEITDHINQRIDYRQYKVDRWIEKFGTVD